MKNEDWKLTDEELSRLDQMKPVEIAPGTEHLFMDEDWLLDESRMTHAEMQQLLREWRDDAAQRPLWEKGVRYEDEYDRMLDEQIERNRFRQQAPDNRRVIEQNEMLKPDHPAWAELVADIKAVLSSRCGDEYAFTSLHRSEQWDFFEVSGFSARYLDQGMTETQVTAVIRSALDGKPQEKWLDGVCDGQALNLENKDGTNHHNAQQAGASLQGHGTAANETYEAMLDQAAKRLGNAKSREQEHER